MKKFLFVDNDTKFTKLLIDNIIEEYHDFESKQCTDEESAIKLLKEEGFDYIIVDFFMETTTGDELIQKISGVYAEPKNIFILTGIHPKEIDDKLRKIKGKYNRVIPKTDFVSEFIKIFDS